MKISSILLIGLTSCQFVNGIKYKMQYPAYEPGESKPRDSSEFTLPFPANSLQKCELPIFKVEELISGEQRQFTVTCEWLMLDYYEDWISLYKQNGYHARVIEGTSMASACGDFFLISFWAWPIYGEISTAPSFYFRCGSAHEIHIRIQNSRLPGGFEPWRVDGVDTPERSLPE